MSRRRSGPRLNIEVTGDELNAGRMRRLARGLADPGEALIAAGDELAQANIERIKRGRGRKLSPGRLAAKRRLGQPSTPLIATGETLEALTPGAEGNNFVVYQSTLRYGVSSLKAAVNHRGKGSRGRRVVVATKAARADAADAARESLVPRRRGLRVADLS